MPTLRIAYVLGGAVTVEVVFARSGLGTLLIKSLNQYDYPVAQACLLLLAMAVMLGTFLGDSCKPRWSRTFRRRCTDSTSFQNAALMRAACSPKGAIAGPWLVALIFVAVAAPLLTPFQYDVQTLKETYLPPSSTHWFGAAPRFQSTG